jgi:hypothetical protein
MERGGAKNECDLVSVDSAQGSEPDAMACRPDGLIEHHFVEARDLPRPLTVLRALAAWTESRKSRTIRTRDQAAFWLGYRPTASFYSAWADSRET